jgi:HAD superfamily hydrolase (TIGR01509 family)
VPIDLVIFDCDGVLVDSEPIAVKIDVQTLAEHGITMTEAEAIERFMGRSPAVMREAIEAHIGRTLPEDWDASAERLYHEAFEAQLRAVAGLEQALAEIDAPTCVASSSGHESLRFKLELTGLYEHFEGRIFSAAEVPNGKPAPDLFLHAAARMGAEPARCVVVEDSVYGVQAARAAGMDVLAYIGGGMVPTEALSGPGTRLFDDMRALPGLVRDLAGGPHAD